MTTDPVEARHSPAGQGLPRFRPGDLTSGDRASRQRMELEVPA
ncbi:hypothetical protein OG873_07360 [Streptomyces violaceus]|uniref:Uncharacterized protein n=1 Tax=Streptomyces violaceus TaxID=1936 RepID=A0ABZ1P1R3_STRVL